MDFFTAKKGEITGLLSYEFTFLISISEFYRYCQGHNPFLYGFEMASIHGNLKLSSGKTDFPI